MHPSSSLCVTVLEGIIGELGEVDVMFGECV